jgi:hypothetical protein
VSAALGLACVLSFGSTPYKLPAVLNACSPDIQLATRAVLAAQGQSSAMIGYAPSANARSGFAITVKIPYVSSTASAGTILNALLATAGLTIGMQFGTAGGVQITGCIAFSCVISGTEGQDLTAQFTFESINMCTTATVVSSPGSFDKVYGFQDVANIALVSGTTYTLLNQFNFRINRVRVPYVGNSPRGLPQKLGIAYTEVTVDEEHLKIDDSEMNTFLGSGTPNYNQTPANVVISVANILNANQNLTLTATNAFYDSAPRRTGAETEWTKESTSSKANTGGYTIA